MLLFEPSKPTNRAKATNCGIIISAERLHLLRFVPVDKSNRIFAIQDYSKTYVYVFGKWIQNKGVFFSIQPSITVFLTLTVGFSPLSSGPRTAYPWTNLFLTNRPFPQIPNFLIPRKSMEEAASSFLSLVWSCVMFHCSMSSAERKRVRCKIT